MQLPLHGTEPRTKEEILGHAKDFLEQYFASIRRYEKIKYIYIYQGYILYRFLHTD